MRPALLSFLLLLSAGTADAQSNLLTRPAPATLSPEGRAAVAAMAGTPLPDPLPPLAVQRRMLGQMQDAMGAALAERYRVRVEAATIAGVPVRIVYPRGVTVLGKGRVLVNLHGGGFQIDSGSLTETIPIAAISGVPVVSVLYRLAPEHPFPAAVDDALAVYGSLLKGRKAAQIAVYGTSAGAVLGAQLVARLIRLRQPVPAALGFFSGSADMTTVGDSESWVPLLPGAKSLAEGIAPYIGRADPQDSLLSPLLGDLSRFPPTLLVSSTRDALLSGTAMFGRKLVERGVDARLVVFDGLPHAFWAYMAIPESDEANRLMATYLRDRLAPRRR